VRRSAPLDGVRGVAILLVLAWHYVSNQVVVEPGSVFAYLLVPLRLSWSGVDLFFVLSGFLIVGNLVDNRHSDNCFRVFYLRRACRIFPIYFCLLAAFVLLSGTSMGISPAYAWLFGQPLPLWTYATFTQNIAMGIRGDLGANWLAITWSLAVEEQFYLVIPFLICALPLRMLAVVLAAAIAMAPLLRFVSPGLLAHIALPWRPDALIAGACVALLVRWPPFMTVVARRRRHVWAMFGVFLAGAAVMTLHPDSFGVFGYLWLAGLYAVFVLIAFGYPDSPTGRALSSSAIVWCGQRSYGIYLFHQAASGVAHGLLHQRSPSVAGAMDAAATLSALGVTLLFAGISYRFVELPAIRYGHRFNYSPTRSAK